MSFFMKSPWSPGLFTAESLWWKAIAQIYQPREHSPVSFKNSDFTEAASCSTPTLQLQDELWEAMIDDQWDDQQFSTTCVCEHERFKYPRRGLDLNRKVCLWDRQDVIRLAKRAHADGKVVKDIVVHGAAFPNRGPIAHLATFAAMLAGRLPHLESLTIQDAKWEPSVMHHDVILHMSAFTSITHLHLSRVVFPSAHVFGRLICTFRNLQHLSCYQVAIAQEGFCPDSFFRPSSLKIHDFDFNQALISDTVIDFLVASGISDMLNTVRLGRKQVPVLIKDVELRPELSLLLWSAGSSLRTLVIHVEGRELGDLDLETTIEPSDYLHILDNDAEPIFSLSLRDLVVHNSSLEVLRLKTLVYEELDYNWIYILLTWISAKSLRHVVLTFYMDSELLTIETTTMFLNILNPYQCSLIDTLLSTPRFAALEAIIFLLSYNHKDPDIPYETRWKSRFLARFPRLCERRTVRAGMLVRHDD